MLKESLVSNITIQPILADLLIFQTFLYIMISTVEKYFVNKPQLFFNHVFFKKNNKPVRRCVLKHIDQKYFWG